MNLTFFMNTTDFMKFIAPRQAAGSFHILSLSITAIMQIGENKVANNNYFVALMAIF